MSIKFQCCENRQPLGYKWFCFLIKIFFWLLDLKAMLLAEICPHQFYNMNSIVLFSTNVISKLALVAVGVLLTECTRFGYKYLKHLRNKKKIRKVIFFPEKIIACNDYFDKVEGCVRTRCEYSHKVTNFRFQFTSLVNKCTLI